MAQILSKSNGRKYAVISEQLYKSLRDINQRTEQTQSPEFKRVKDLDEEIHEILADKSLSIEKKAKIYSQIAGKYLAYREKAPEISRKQEQPAYFIPKVTDETLSSLKNQADESFSPVEQQEEEDEFLDASGEPPPMAVAKSIP